MTTTDSLLHNQAASTGRLNKSGNAIGFSGAGRLLFARRLKLNESGVVLKLIKTRGEEMEVQRSSGRLSSGRSGLSWQRITKTTTTRN